MFRSKKYFYTLPFFYEGDVLISIKEIAGVAVRGRSIFGFFITEKEFDVLFPKVHEVDGDYRVMPILEAKRKFFKKASDVYMEELLQTHKIPIRKIRVWHQLGLSFKE